MSRDWQSEDAAIFLPTGRFDTPLLASFLAIATENYQNCHIGKISLPP
jgi:hypothetical protein